MQIQEENNWVGGQNEIRVILFSLFAASHSMISAFSGVWDAANWVIEGRTHNRRDPIER
jgi:hypothetical protein